MADQPLVRNHLEIAGYDAIEFERINTLVMMGRTLDDAVAFQLSIGLAGEIYREAGAIAAKRHELSLL